MTMESIEKLRELLKGCGCSDKCYSCGINYHGSIADEIEAEIAERYMLLPCDADGVPIRVGDMVSLNGREPFEVGGVRDTRNQWHVFPYDLQRWYAPLDLHHVKPRTIEDVLHDFWEEWESHPIDAEWGVRLERLRESEAKYADELRKLMEVDE